MWRQHLKRDVKTANMTEKFWVTAEFANVIVNVKINDCHFSKSDRKIWNIIANLWNVTAMIKFIWNFWQFIYGHNLICDCNFSTFAVTWLSFFAEVWTQLCRIWQSHFTLWAQIVENYSQISKVAVKWLQLSTICSHNLKCDCKFYKVDNHGTGKKMQSHCKIMTVKCWKL